jgi:hypothetical protein
MEHLDWKMNLNNDQIWTLVIGILFAISEVMGMFKRGPNGILHGVWKFYNLKVDIEYDANGEEVDEADEEHRVNQTNLPNRETVVMESREGGNIVDPNVLLIRNKN